MASTFELALPVWQVLQGAPSVSMATGRQLEPANNERLCRCRTPFPASPSGLSFGLITAYQETRVLDPNQNRPQSVSVGLIGVPRNVLASLSNTWHLGPRRASAPTSFIRPSSLLFRSAFQPHPQYRLCPNAWECLKGVPRHPAAAHFTSKKKSRWQAVQVTSDLR